MANPQMEDGYAPVANELLEALNRARFGSTQAACIGWLKRNTFGWSRKACAFPGWPRIAADLKRDAANIRKCFGKLCDFGVVWMDGVEMGIQKDYTLWDKAVFMVRAGRIEQGEKQGEKQGINTLGTTGGQHLKVQVVNTSLPCSKTIFKNKDGKTTQTPAGAGDIFSKATANAWPTLAEAVAAGADPRTWRGWASMPPAERDPYEVQVREVMEQRLGADVRAWSDVQLVKIGGQLEAMCGGIHPFDTSDLIECATLRGLADLVRVERSVRGLYGQSGKRGEPGAPSEARG